jgi:hypothetical protein
VKNKHGSIRFGFKKPDRPSISGKTLKPGSWFLLEAIEGLMEPTYIVRMMGVDKAGGLLTVNNLIEVAMKEGIFTSS